MTDTPPPYPSLAIRFFVQALRGAAHRREALRGEALRGEALRGEAVALVDTGFDGHLALPERLIDTLPPPAYLRRVRMASGQVLRVPVYPGRVELVDQPRPFDGLMIALGDEYLLGLPAINHFRVTFDHGERLIVEP